MTYTIDRDGDILADGMAIVQQPREVHASYLGEMIRRANALPEVEAKLAEAVELLWRAVALQPVTNPMHAIDLSIDARAFLDKVKA